MKVSKLKMIAVVLSVVTVPSIASSSDWKTFSLRTDKLEQLTNSGNEMLLKQYESQQGTINTLCEMVGLLAAINVKAMESLTEVVEAQNKTITSLAETVKSQSTNAHGPNPLRHSYMFSSPFGQGGQGTNAHDPGPIGLDYMFRSLFG